MASKMALIAFKLTSNDFKNNLKQNLNWLQMVSKTASNGLKSYLHVNLVLQSTKKPQDKCCFLGLLLDLQVYYYHPDSNSSSLRISGRTPTVPEQRLFKTHVALQTFSSSAERSNLTSQQRYLNSRQNLRRREKNLPPIKIASM